MLVSYGIVVTSSIVDNAASGKLSAIAGILPAIAFYEQEIRLSDKSAAITPLLLE